MTTPHTTGRTPPTPRPPRTPETARASRTVRTLDRRHGPYGEVVLRRRGEDYEIIANGCFLMDTSDGRSERLLVDAAYGALTAGAPVTAENHRAQVPGSGDLGPSLLIGGLGVGFSLAHAAANPGWGRIAVVEREEAIIDWHMTGPLAPLSRDALADPRSVIIHRDLLTHLRESRDRYDAICLDIDNGPDWTVTDDNRNLYAPSGLALCQGRLAPGGILAVWSAQPSPAFEEALRNAGFSAVRTEEIRVARGAPDVVHLAVRPA
ncbi:spermidine synthase [Streptomyces sp. NPDC051018]|uniref:spermidine synthase n=1 Tax=Streptomyces sp. NPDC051018 TaxID=3365639 RepID=UPI0037B87A6C